MPAKHGLEPSLQSTAGYFDAVEYVKVPAFWSKLMDPAQFHHGLTSVSDQEASQDGWSRWTDMPLTVGTAREDPGWKRLLCGLHAVRVSCIASDDARV